MNVCPSRIRTKLCGLTRPQDIDAAVHSGADAIGLVFYPPSKRAVSVEQAVVLRRRIPAFVSAVALFVNPQPSDVQHVLDYVRPDLLQFHGDESPEFCASFNRPYMKAFRVGGQGLATPEAVLAQARLYQEAGAWLFDAYSVGYGGSGLTFDPRLLSAVFSATDTPPVVIAGGLTPETVAGAVRDIRPFAVDVSSGIEDSPGVKNYARMLAFVDQVSSVKG